MAIQSFQGRPFLLGPSLNIQGGSGPTANGVTINAVNQAHIQVGRVRTSDGASHTIDATGSSQFGFRSGSPNTFSSGSTTVKIGLAPVDTSNGPPGRASNTTNVIDFDVAAVIAGGSITWNSNQWVSVAPTTGTKTVADGDLVAFCLQMTARGGSDQVNWDYLNANGQTNIPCLTLYNGSYTARTGAVSGIFRFSDGAYGWLEGTEIFNTLNSRAWNSGSATKEYGQLIQMPFPMRVCGIYGAFGAADTDIVLYSDPLGTPVAQRTATFDSNTSWAAQGNWTYAVFSSPYDVAANTAIGAVLKPGASSLTAWYKTLQHADHRAADPWGTSGYGISRASGAFANANSSLDHYYIGLMLNGFDAGGSGGGSVGVIGS